MVQRFWRQEVGDGPLVAVAIHHGHGLRDEVARLSALSEADRLREEDPFTGEWAVVAPTRLVVETSRFEVDLNRPRDRAVYRRPEDAWGLQLWSSDLADDVVDRSLAKYDAFHDALGAVLSAKERFVVLDLHSYNHRREGPAGPPADPEQNPQVNVGTGTLDRDRWGALVDRFMADLRAFDFPGGALDVRENVKFQGGHLSRWVHETFPGRGCALAIEFKKFFMDEWTGEPDPRLMEAIGAALGSATDGLLEEVGRA